MSAPIAVQLYSLREAAQGGFEAVLERVSSIGYAGVEAFDLYGMTPRAFRERVEELGMRVASSHYPWANHAPLTEVVDVLGELELRRAAAGFAAADFEDMDAVRRTADEVNGLVDALAAEGLELFLHNHWWEFETIQGVPAYHHLAELCPGVRFEIDTYWAANFGARDPAAEVARLKERVPLLHIKDGPLERDAAHVAVGKGAMNVRAVIEAADPDVLDWVIVELDRCDTDMYTAITDSYDYLITNALAEGWS